MRPESPTEWFPNQMAANEPKTRDGQSRTRILDIAQRIVVVKGFTRVGLNEILAAAGVPKGSFYHYFDSKEAFGKALLDRYFTKDFSQVDEFLSAPGRNARDRLTAYWNFFRANQENHDHAGKCLSVKLGAEVSDMSEEMRLALKAGTSGIISRLSRVIMEGKSDGSIPVLGDPTETANTLYQLWMGASVMWKISRDGVAFNNANAATERILSGDAL